MFENILEKKIDNLGLIAGGGDLPLKILDFCEKNNIKLKVVLIDDFADKKKYENVEFINSGFGEIGKVFKFFKKNKIKNVVFAGFVKKPSSLLKLKIDFKGIFLLLKLLKLKIFSDNSILDIVVQFSEKNGFKILEIDKILNDIKLSIGNNTTTKITTEYLEGIKIGKDTLEKMSSLDIAQSIIIQNKKVLAIEAIEGTQKLIERTKELKYIDGKPILVKIKKLAQTRKADLPTIGVNTIQQLYDAGFAGIALDSKNCLVIDPKETIVLANKLSIFIYGF